MALEEDKLERQRALRGARRINERTENVENVFYV